MFMLLFPISTHIVDSASRKVIKAAIFFSGGH